MSADRIVGGSTFMDFGRRCLVSVVSGFVIACMLVAAFAKLAELLDVDSSQAYVQSTPRTVQVASVSTQTNGAREGVLYGGHGLSSIESRNGLLYFVEKTGAEYGPKSWSDLHSNIAGKKGCGTCRKGSHA